MYEIKLGFFPSFQIMLEKRQKISENVVTNIETKIQMSFTSLRYTPLIEIGPFLSTKFESGFKNRFQKEVELQQNYEMNRNTNFPKESNHVGASTIEELMMRISFSFPLNSEPTWTATVDKVVIGPGANRN